MEPMKLSAYKVAKDIRVSAPTVNEIVRGKKSVTAEMAIRLSRYFGTSRELWLNLQTQYDLELADAKIGAAVARSVTPASDNAVA
jgi:addiction module HigA family antidote